MNVIRGDARSLPLPDGSVDLVITSPPYWALRSYTDGGEHYAGQIGAEPTPGAYVDNLIACTREWMRVLKPSGSLWINLGDKYAGADVQPPQSASTTLGGGKHAGVSNLGPPRRVDTSSVRAKSLIGLPWRYALRCIDELGLILRAEVIWSKPNGLPESVTDRVRRSHEQWFHFVRSPRYFSAVDEIREAHAPASVVRYTARTPFNHPDSEGRVEVSGATVGGSRALVINPLGKLPGSVWTIPTEPLSVPDHLGVDHFAAFPIEWPRRIIQGWSPSGICTACGEGRRPVSDVTRVPHYAGGSKGRAPGCNGGTPGTFDDERVPRTNPVYQVTGYVCACPDTSAPTRPSVVLDPFGGTGTTALAARALGRVGVSVDMSADYCRLAQWRTNDRGELARAMRVEKPAPVSDDQLAFDLVVA